MAEYWADLHFASESAVRLRVASARGRAESIGPSPALLVPWWTRIDTHHTHAQNNIHHRTPIIAARPGPMVLRPT